MVEIQKRTKVARLSTFLFGISFMWMVTCGWLMACGRVQSLIAAGIATGFGAVSEILWRCGR